MKKIILIAVISLGIFALIGCGKTAEKANTEAPKEVSPEKTFKVDELVDKVMAEKDTWKGKEVIVTGLVWSRSGVAKVLVTKRFDPKTVMCIHPPSQQQLELSETIEVKGKISELTTNNVETTVKLEPCEIKK